MPDRVYIETTVVSYLTARPSRDLVVAGHQQSTHEWWHNHRGPFELCASELVIHEAGSGDSEAAQERLAVLQEMTLLETRPEALKLAEALVRGGALPAKAFEDALHIAIVAQQAVPFLLTWNLRHMANAVMRPMIEAVCVDRGFRAPIICTPEELRRVTP